MKKLLSILLTAVMLFSVFSTTSVVTLAADNNTPVVTEEKVEAGIFDGILSFFSDIISSILDLFTFEKELPDVSEWTDEEIIDYYKKAARKTRFVKADRTFVDNGYEITNYEGPNGDTDFELLFTDAFLDGYFQGLNDAQIKGVMGDYRKLTIEDCKSIKAYTDGEYTVIELKFHDQHDSTNDEKDKITLSHAMEDFGELSPALSKVPLMLGVTMKIPNSVAEYTNATAKVKINSRGKVEYGTWTYDVVCDSTDVVGEISYPPLRFEFDMKMDVSCTMTIGGGF